MPRHLPRTILLTALFTVAPAGAAAAQEAPTTTAVGQPAATRTAIIAAVIARHDPTLADSYLKAAAGEGTDPEQAAATTLAAFTRTNAPGAAKVTLDLYRTDPAIARTVTLTILADPAVGAAIFEPMYALTTAAEVDGFLHVLEPTIDAAWELMVRFGPNTQDAIARAKARQLLDSPPTSGALIPVEQYATGTTTPPATTAAPPTTVLAVTTTTWAMFTPVPTTIPAATMPAAPAVGSTGRAGTGTRTSGEGGAQFPRWFLAFVLAAGVLGYWWLQDRQEQDGKDAAGKPGGAAPRQKRDRWTHHDDGRIVGPARARRKAARLFAPYTHRKVFAAPDVDPGGLSGTGPDHAVRLGLQAARYTSGIGGWWRRWQVRRWWTLNVNGGRGSALNWPSRLVAFDLYPDRRVLTVSAVKTQGVEELSRLFDELGVVSDHTRFTVDRVQGSARQVQVTMTDAVPVPVVRTHRGTRRPVAVTVDGETRQEMHDDGIVVQVEIGRMWTSVYDPTVTWFEPASAYVDRTGDTDPFVMCTPAGPSPDPVAVRSTGDGGVQRQHSDSTAAGSGAHNTFRLSAARAQVLAAIGDRSGRLADIARWVGRDSGNLSRTLARMVDAGLVERAGDLYRVTPFGAAVAAGGGTTEVLHVEPPTPPAQPVPVPVPVAVGARSPFDAPPVPVDRRVPYRPVPGSPLDNPQTGDTPWS